jgi:hypothetical protein
MADRTRGNLLNELVEVADAALDLIGEGDWTPQDSLLRHICREVKANREAAAEASVEAHAYDDGTPARHFYALGVSFAAGMLGADMATWASPERETMVTARREAIAAEAREWLGERK